VKSADGCLVAEDADNGATNPRLPDRGPDQERRGLRSKRGLSKKIWSFGPSRDHEEVKGRR
jgi:hypothetical protein